MSGSSGLNLTPDTLLKLYQPEIILWLYSKTEPLKAFDFCFDDGILRQYFEFDRMYNEVKSGKANDLTKAILYNAEIEGRTVETVPMNLLVQLGSWWISRWTCWSLFFARSARLTPSINSPTGWTGRNSGWSNARRRVSTDCVLHAIGRCMIRCRKPACGSRAVICVHQCGRIHAR